eukprot:COSAG05_NODE_12603_length_462_cov_0.526171_1_plen_44_part_01
MESANRVTGRLLQATLNVKTAQPGTLLLSMGVHVHSGRMTRRST